MIRKASKSNNKAVIKNINNNFSDDFILSELNSQLNGIKNIKTIAGKQKRAIIVFKTPQEMAEAVSKKM